MAALAFLAEPLDFVIAQTANGIKDEMKLLEPLNLRIGDENCTACRSPISGEPAKQHPIPDGVAVDAEFCSDLSSDLSSGP